MMKTQLADRDTPRDVLATTGTYLRYGIFPEVDVKALCPACKKRLNIGPNYKPKYCPECGQAVNTKPYEEMYNMVTGKK